MINRVSHFLSSIHLHVSIHIVLLSISVGISTLASIQGIQLAHINLNIIECRISQNNFIHHLVSNHRKIFVSTLKFINLCAIQEFKSSEALPLRGCSCVILAHMPKAKTMEVINPEMTIPPRFALATFSMCTSINYVVWIWRG